MISRNTAFTYRDKQIDTRRIGRELSVRYVRRTPVERPLVGRGRAVKQSGKYLDLEGTLEDLESGEVVAKATGRFFPMPEAG